MAKQIPFVVVAASEYCEHLIAHIQRAQRSIIIAAMVIRSGTETRRVLAACIEAARRGVAIHIIVDPYGQLMLNRPKPLSKRDYKEECAYTRQQLNHIHALGGTAEWVGHIGLVPYMGRYHVKATIIDDHVYSFGGLNMTDDSFQEIDYMVYAHDAQLASRLTNLLRANTGDGANPNVQQGIDTHSTLLFDGGRRGDSLIYDRACSLTKDAHKVTYISLMCPSGRLAALLKNVNSTCYFNRPEQVDSLLPRLAQQFDLFRTGITNHYKGKILIHAKCMLFEMKDGTKVVLSGSHNFSWRGVTFGTKEIALQSTDQQLWRRLHDIVYAVATGE